MSGAPRILLVDDELSIVKMVGKRLEVEGFTVLAAMDGEEALAKAQQDKPDLIILDLMLPKLSGFEVCGKLKQDPACRRIPIVVFTAKTAEQDEQMAMECGADAYVRKPFRAQDLLGHIRRLLATSKGSEGATS